MPTLRILAIGDSLTAGDEQNPSGYRSYRGAILTKFATAGYAVDFVGRNQSVPASGGTDPDHEGYGGAFISDAGVGATNASNNIYDRIPAMKTALGAVDAIFLFTGWNDVYNQPTNAASRMTALISYIQSGIWANTKLFCFTLHPEQNKTATQTATDNAAWQPINDAIRSAVTASPSNRYLVDLANLSGSNAASEMVETLLYDALTPPNYTVIKGGANLPSPKGGHLVTSFKSMQDYCAQWTTQVSGRIGANGNPNDMMTDGGAVQGNPIFVNGVQSVIPWLWMFAAPGHAASNTVIEARNMFAQARRKSNGNWEFFFQGARPGANGGGDIYLSEDGGKGPYSGIRDGVTSWYRPDDNSMVETWPYDTSPSRGIEAFLGGRNRSLMADAEVFVVGVQVRLALLNPNGPNDIASSKLAACCGLDYGGVPGYSKRYDYYGWPLTVMDGGHDRWKEITSTDWTWVGSVTIGRNTASWLGPNSTEHYEDPGLQPPLASWSPATPYNNMPTYSVSVASVRAAPPPLPIYVTVSGGASNSWVSADYADSIHMSQQGAEKTAQAVFDATVASGIFSGVANMLPGIPEAGAWDARYVTESTSPATATWGNISLATSAQFAGTSALSVLLTGTLTNRIRMVGSVNGALTTTSALRVSPRFAGSLAVSGAATGSLFNRIQMTGATNASVTADSSLRLSVRFVGSTSGRANLEAGFSPLIRFIGSSSASVTNTAQIRVSPRFAGSIETSLVSSANIRVGARMASSIVISNAVSAQLNTRIQLRGFVIAVANTSGQVATRTLFTGGSNLRAQLFSAALSNYLRQAQITEEIQMSTFVIEILASAYVTAPFTETSTVKI